MPTLPSLRPFWYESLMELNNPPHPLGGFFSCPQVAIFFLIVVGSNMEKYGKIRT